MEAASLWIFFIISYVRRTPLSRDNIAFGIDILCTIAELHVAVEM